MIEIETKGLQPNGKYLCEFCNREISKHGIKNHIRMKHTEEGQLKIKNRKEDTFKDSRGWSKGLTKENDIRVQKISQVLKDKFDKGELTGSFTGKHHTDETKNKISENKNGKMGGYRKGSGRGKSGWYKDYWCDSSWELAFVIYNLEHDIPFTRNTEKFQYEFNNEKHNYIPDFIMGDGSYVEIKGYETEQTLAKYIVCPNIIILKYEDLTNIFDYVNLKYGIDYIKLYE